MVEIIKIPVADVWSRQIRWVRSAIGLYLSTGYIAGGGVGSMKP